jgi:hypothetical protein
MLKYLRETYNPEHLKGKAGQVKTPDPVMPALKKAMQAFHRADRKARGVRPKPHGAPKKPESSEGYKKRMEKETGEAERSGELQRRGNWPGKVQQIGRKDAGTEYEGPSLKEKVEKLRRGHSVPRRGEKKHPTIQGGWLSRASETPGAGRVLVGSWAQRRHRKPGSRGDAPITYADK